MSSLRLYQMYDSVAMQVTGPIIAATRDEAVIRQFTDVLARPETLPGQYPEDFSIMFIGEQNQDTAEIKPRDPQFIYTGRVWLRLQQQKADVASAAPFPSAARGEQPPNDT